MLIIIPFIGKSAEHVTLTLQNPSATSTNIEFDVYLVNDGTTALKIAGYQFGINFSSSILNGGTPSSTAYEYIAGTRDAALNALTAPSVQYNNSQLKVSSTPIPLINSVAMTTGFQYKLGRFRFINTNAWLAGSMPDLQFQLLSSPGKTHALVIAYVDASITNTPMGVANTFLSTVNNTTGFTLNIPLPVQLINFSGKQFASDNLLTWNTASEINNAGFNLQYSKDGIHFTDLQFVETKAIGGNCNCLNEYSFLHQSVSFGHHYYRLEQIDIDGKKSYVGSIIDLIREQDNNISIYPNPASAQFSVQISSLSTQQIQLQLTDMQGHVLYTSKSNITKGVQSLPIDISKFANGNYMLLVSSNNLPLWKGKITKID